MSDYLSNEEMKKLEGAGSVESIDLKYQSQGDDFISDEDMGSLDSEGKTSPAKSLGKKTSTMQALGDAFTQGITLGYGPQLEAMAAPAMKKLVEWQTGTDDLPMDPYVERRDQALKRYNEEFKENPVLSTTAMIGGGVAGAIPLAGLTAAKGATALARMGQAAKAGAGIGFVANPGDTEGETSGLQIGDRLKNAGIGAGTGLVVQGGLEGISKASKSLVDPLRKFAEEKAVKSTGTLKKGLSELQKRGKTNEVGRMLLDEDVVTLGATPRKISERLGPKIKAKMAEVDELIKASDETSVGIDIESLALKVKEEVLDEYPGVPEEKLTPILNEIDLWFQNKDMSLSDGQTMKQSMNKFLGNRDFLKDNPSSKTEGMLRVRKGVKGAIEDGVGVEGMPGAVKDANRQAGNYITAQDLSDEGTIRDASNRMMGLSEQLGLMGGVARGDNIVKDGVIGTAMAAGNRLAKTYGNSTMAVGADKLADVLQTPRLIEAIKNNPEQAQKLLPRLMGGTGMLKGDKPNSIYKNKELYDLISERPELIDSIENEDLKEKLRTYTQGRPGFTRYKVDENEAKEEYLKGN